ncbi:transaldolase [Candidatus Pelagibacter sp.]|nr:transaldolase [Candidatus Pelagibacter sp.]
MTKLYCDTSNLSDIRFCIKKYNIDGVTTNPSIMRNEGVKNYKKHCQKILNIIDNRPLSVEVFADKENDIKKQAIKISSWGKNVFVKIPVINTKGIFLKNTIKELNSNNIKINITAVFTLEQILKIKEQINKKTPVIISIFCGRIADSGIDPEPIIIRAKKEFKNFKNVKILWASVREIFNFYQAKKTKSDVITVPPDLIKKIKSKKIKLTDYSKLTVKQFFNDGKKSKFKI